MVCVEENELSRGGGEGGGNRRPIAILIDRSSRYPGTAWALGGSGFVVGFSWAGGRMGGACDGDTCGGGPDWAEGRWMGLDCKCVQERDRESRRA